MGMVFGIKLFCFLENKKGEKEDERWTESKFSLVQRIRIQNFPHILNPIMVRS